jgi:hypothetical protein
MRETLQDHPLDTEALKRAGDLAVTFLEPAETDAIVGGIRCNAHGNGSGQETLTAASQLSGEMASIAKLESLLPFGFT